MGQKNNSNFLRSYKKFSFDSCYIEKNFEEITYVSFFDIEIKKFIFRFFTIHGISIIFCKTSFSNNSLKLFLSFFITLKSLKILNNLNLTHYKIKHFKGYIKRKKMFFFFLIEDLF